MLQLAEPRSEFFAIHEKGCNSPGPILLKGIVKHNLANQTKIMKALTSFSLLFWATTLLLSESTFAATAAKPPPPPPPPALENWQTVDDFQDGIGGGAENAGLTVGPSGTLFGVGTGYPDGGYSRGIIRASPDGGNTWSLVSALGHPALLSAWYAGIVSDSAGNLYVAGTAYDDGTTNGGLLHWIVQSSTDGGATWLLVDDFVPGGDTWTQVTGLTVDTAGNVYVAGVADYGPPSYDPLYATSPASYVWTIRKGIGGSSFTTVDSVPYNAWEFGPQGIYSHPAGGIFAVGDVRRYTTNRNNTVSASRAWVVRRSLNGGATWQNVDTFQLNSGYNSLARGIGADVLGNIYVVGNAIGPSVKGTAWAHWVVRKSSNGGTSWTSVDDYQLDSSNYSMAYRFAVDVSGNLYVAGFGNTGSGYNSHWIVRKSVGGTGSWATVDNFQHAGSGSIASAIVADASGKVFVGGSGGGHWLVRRSP
jgi:hypothetical protein